MQEFMSTVNSNKFSEFSHNNGDKFSLTHQNFGLTTNSFKNQGKLISSSLNSPLKTTWERILNKESSPGTQPFTNFYPIGGGGRVIAQPQYKTISSVKKDNENDILKNAEKSDSEDKSFDYGAGPVATLSSP